MFGGRKPSTPQPSGMPTPPNPPPTPTPPSSAVTPPARQAVGFETVLGANTAFKGEIKSRANVRIDGQFEGDVQVDGSCWSARRRAFTATCRRRAKSAWRARCAAT